MVKNNYHEVGIINFKYYNNYLLKNNNYTYILKKLLKKTCVPFLDVPGLGLYSLQTFFFLRGKNFNL